MLVLNFLGITIIFDLVFDAAESLINSMTKHSVDGVNRVRNLTGGMEKMLVPICSLSIQGLW